MAAMGTAMRNTLRAFALGMMILCVPRGAIAQQCCAGEQCPGDLDCDNRVVISELLTAVNAALKDCPAVVSTPTAIPGGEQRFPATGQTTCWDITGSVIACSGTGQDG